MKKFSLPIEEQERILCVQLIQHNIEYSKAVVVSKILVSKGIDGDLTDEELQITQEVCRQWLAQRQRRQWLEATIESVLSE